MEQLVDFRPPERGWRSTPPACWWSAAPAARGRGGGDAGDAVGADAGAGAGARAGYAAAHAYPVPRVRFAGGRGAWSAREVQRLMDRIAAAGVPLRDHLAAPVSAGVRTGLNDAFVVDAATRDRLVPPTRAPPTR